MKQNTHNKAVKSLTTFAGTLIGLSVDKEIAKELIEIIEGNNKRMFAFLPKLEAACTEEEYDLLKREIARVATGIDMKLYPLVLQQHPDLDPLKKGKL